MDTMKMSQICKALGDVNRLEIINMLSAGEKCGCKLLEQFEISQPTLSHHMKILIECGLVKERKQGKWHHYSLHDENLQAFYQSIKNLGQEERSQSL